MNDVFNDKKISKISQSRPIKQNRNMSTRFARRLLPKQPMPDIKEKKQEIVATLNCVICQEPLQKVNKIILSCGHEFCASCILRNLNYTRKCPLCRTEIVKNPFHSLERSVSKFIVSEVIKDQSLASIIVRLHKLFQKSEPNLLDNNTEFNEECVMEFSDILGNFGLDICDYIRLLYRK